MASWVFLPIHPHARWTTLATIVALLIVITWRTRRPWVAAVAVLAWLGVFELTWQMGQVLHGRESPLAEAQSLVFQLPGPLLAAAIGLWPERRWLTGAAAVFAVWFALGLHSNWWYDPGGFSARDEVLNVASKEALAVAFLLGALRRQPGGGLVPALLRRRPAA